MGPISLERRKFTVSGELWSVSERDARDVPGARALTCLVFESQDTVRRCWSFPPNWRDMDDSALGRLNESTMSSSTLIESLQTAFITSIVAERTAAELLVAVRGVLEENRALRDQRRVLLLCCRAARRESHELVATYARLERTAGASVAEAVKNLAAPVQTAAFVVSDPQRTERLVSDVARWCDEEFRAA